jgi:hypothetical protein
MSPRQPLYFWHIPKTAGTSFIQWLDSHFDAANIFAPQLLPGLEQEGESFDGKQLYRGHLAGEVPKRIGRTLTCVTLLREPRARTLSHLAHIHRESGHYLHERLVDKGTDLADLAADPVLRLALTDVQARYLAVDPALTAAPAPIPVRTELYRQAQYELSPLPPTFALLRRALVRLVRMSDFGVAEDLDLFARRVAQRQGWPMPASLPRENVTTSSPWRLEHMAPTELTLLDRMNPVDTRLYQVARPLSRIRTRMERPVEVARTCGGLP